MLLKRFIGILLCCYSVYYFFILLIDLIKSKSPAVAADRKSLHKIEYELPEKPNVQGQRVSNETHPDISSTNLAISSPTSPKAKIENYQEEIDEDHEENRDEEESSSSRISLMSGYDFREEQKLFSLEHEELTGGGIEIAAENFNKLISIL